MGWGDVQCWDEVVVMIREGNDEENVGMDPGGLIGQEWAEPRANVLCHGLENRELIRRCPFLD